MKRPYEVALNKLKPDERIHYCVEQRRLQQTNPAPHIIELIRKLEQAAIDEKPTKCGYQRGRHLTLLIAATDDLFMYTDTRFIK